LFTFANDNIGNSTSQDTISSAIPYVTILGSGNGSYDEYRFEIIPDMLSRPGGDFGGSLNDDSDRDYYTQVGTRLLGGVGKGDEWTITVNDKFSFSYVANSGDGLAQVADGLQSDFDRQIGDLTDSNLVPSYTLTATGDLITIQDENGFWVNFTQKVASAAEVTRQVSTVSTVSFDTVELTLDGTPSEMWRQAPPLTILLRRF
jgi:hypothetical protein